MPRLRSIGIVLNKLIVSVLVDGAFLDNSFLVYTYLDKSISFVLRKRVFCHLGNTAPQSALVHCVYAAWVRFTTMLLSVYLESVHIYLGHTSPLISPQRDESGGSFLGDAYPIYPRTVEGLSGDNGVG